MRAFLLTLMLIFLFSGFAFAEMRPPHNENSDSVFVKDSVSVCNDKSVENKQKKQLLLPIVLLGAALILTCGVVTVDFEGSGSKWRKFGFVCALISVPVVLIFAGALSGNLDVVVDVVDFLIRILSED